MDVEPALADPFMRGQYTLCTDLERGKQTADQGQDSEQSDDDVPVSPVRRRIFTRQSSRLASIAAAARKPSKAATKTSSKPSSKQHAADMTLLIESMMQMQQDTMEFMRQTIAVQNKQADKMQAAQLVQLEAQHEQSAAVFSTLETLVSARERVQSQKMVVTPFDGSTENADAWLLMYERACDANGWTTDASKVNNLKGSFKQGSTAQKWFDSRLLVAPQANWQDWREAFISAFKTNIIDATRKAMTWEFRGGSLLDFVYEMERLLTLAYGTVVVSADNHRLLINNVAVALPRELANQICLSDPKTKAEFMTCIQRLSVKAKTEKQQPGPASHVSSGRHAYQQFQQQFQQHFQRQDVPYNRYTPPAPTQQQARPQQHPTVPAIQWQPQRSLPQGNRSQSQGIVTQPFSSHQRKPQWQPPSRRVHHVDHENSQSKPQIVELPPERETEKKHIHHIRIDATAPLPVYYVRVHPGNLRLATLFDTGSNDDLIAEAVVSSNNMPFVRDKRTFIDFNGMHFIADRYVDVQVNIGDRCQKVKMWVFKDLNFDMLLGYTTLAALDINLTNVSQLKAVSSVQSTGYIYSTDQIADLFPSLLRPFRERQTAYHVPFKVNADIPIIQHKPYRLSPLKEVFADQKVQEMLDDGLLEPTTSDFASPCLVVDKKDDPDGTTNKKRLCTDFREVNKHCTQNPFPLPNIQDLLQRSGGATCFSKIDLRDSFWQLPLEPETRMYTAFVTPKHHVQYTCLPFGYRNSPQLFMKFMTQHVLRELLHDHRIGCYIDDVWVACATRDECARLTFVILKRYAEVGLIINIKKTQICVPNIKILGRIFDGITMTTKSECREKALNSRDPHDIHTLRSFCGLIETFRDRIPHLSDIMRPINALRKKGMPFIWTEDCQKAKATLMKIITDDPILCLPDWSLPFELMTDASHLGTGACLYQRDQTCAKKSQLRLIGFHSYSFNKHEVGYCVAEKEALAIVKAIKHFRTFLEGRKFIIRTDHAALTALKNKDEPRGRLLRWTVFLMTFDFEIIHRKGSQHHDADCLSRLFLPHDTTADHDNTFARHVATVQQVTNDHQKYHILSLFHDDVGSGGHSGVRATIAKISPRFQWKGMTKDITDYVLSCHVCQMTKFKFRPKTSYMIVPEHGSSPYQVVNIDHGELAKKHDGVIATRSFIVLVCQHTRMLHVQPCKESSQAVIKFFEQQSFLPLVRKIISDNGSAFTSQAFQHFCMSHGIKHITTAINNPSANMAERYVQIVKKFCSSYPFFPGGWRACVLAAAAVHNCTPSRILGCSPKFKLTGKRPSFPADTRLGIDVSMLAPEKATCEARVEETRRRVQQQHNAKKHFPSFAVGDHILFSHSQSSSHKPLVSGPVELAQVTEKQGHPITLVTMDGTAVSPKNAVKYKARVPYKSLGFASLLSMFLLIAISCATFVQESPVLFAKSDIPVIARWVHVHHELVFSDPCHNFTQEQDIHNATIRKHLKQWCSLKYHKEVIEPLFSIAQDMTTRHKRQLILGGIAIGTAIIGIGKMYTQISENAHNIDQLQSSINILRTVMRNNKMHLNNIIMAIEERDRLLQDHEEILRDLPGMSTMIADAAAAIAVEGAQILTIIREYQRHRRIHPSFFDLFRVGLPAHAIMDNVRVISAWKVAGDGYLTLDYQVPFANPNVSLNEAQAFNMFVRNTNGSAVQQCEMHYVGPSFALVTSTCAFGMSVTPAQVSSTAYSVQNNTYCPITSPNDQQKYWTTHRCTPPYQPPSQVKFTITDAYIYCPDWNITLSNVSISCPDFVFRLPITSSFRIGNTVHDGDYRLVLHRNVSLTDHLLIMHHLYSSGTRSSFTFNNQLNATTVAIDADISALENIPTFLSQRSNLFLITISLICLILITINALQCYLRLRQGVCCKRHEARANAPPPVEIIPMRTRRPRIRNIVASDDEE